MKPTAMRKTAPAQLRAEIPQQSRLAAVGVVSPPIGERDDIVLDILQRMAARVQLHIEAFAELEAEIRREWGGCHAYVLKVGQSGRAAFSRRDERIRYEHERGEHAELLARRYGVSIRRIQQIVSA